MVKFLAGLAAFLLVNSFCCFGPGTEPPSDPWQVRQDSIDHAERVYWSMTLEDMLAIGTEDSLLESISHHVDFDTVHYSSDSFMVTTRILRDSMCTIRIFWNGTTQGMVMSHIELTVDDSLTFAEIQRITVSSKTGIRLGMSLQEVQNINFEPFYIYGIGGDSSLKFMSWENGRLWNSGLEVNYFVPGDHSDCGNPLICGDTVVVSNEPALRGFDTCYVRSITVRKVR